MKKRATKKKTPEGQILASILEYLEIRGIWATRMQSGLIRSTHNGKSRAFRVGTVGMADIFVLIPDPSPYVEGVFIPLWLEVKTKNGKQSEAQKKFSDKVRLAGHCYAVVRSIEDLDDVFFEMFYEAGFKKDSFLKTFYSRIKDV